MRCDDIDDMTLKCHVRRQATLQLIKVKAYPGPWPLAPGPWPSIPVSLLPTKCSEQAAAGSRRQQQQTAGSSGQQQGQLNQAEFLIFEMSWNMKMV